MIPSTRHFNLCFRTLSLVFAMAFVASGDLRAQGSQSQDAAERFTATAVNMAAMSSGPVTTPVSIVITRWSTDAERDALVTALREQGPNAVLDKLKDMPRAGSIAATGSVGQEIHFARRIPGANKSERVVLITDRRMSLWELRSGSQTIDYPFTLVELRVGADGKGEGKASVATKIILEPGSKNVVLENWATQPTALQNVRREK
jgi:hypothetical protein